MFGRLKHFISFNKSLKIQRNYRRFLNEVKQNFNPVLCSSTYLSAFTQHDFC